jgi:hypothetical protein
MCLWPPTILTRTHPYWIARTVIELETNKADLAILEVPAREPEIKIKVVSQNSFPLPKRPYRYRVTSI